MADPRTPSDLGQLLEARGALATFSAQGLGGPGDSCASPRYAAPPSPIKQLVGFFSSTERALTPNADLATPGLGADGALKLPTTPAAALPGLLRLSEEEAAVKAGANAAAAAGLPMLG